MRSARLLGWSLMLLNDEPPSLFVPEVGLPPSDATGIADTNAANALACGATDIKHLVYLVGAFLKLYHLWAENAVFIYSSRYRNENFLLIHLYLSPPEIADRMHRVSVLWSDARKLRVA